LTQDILPYSTVLHLVLDITGTMALELQHTRLATAPPEMKRTGSRKAQLELPRGLTVASMQKRPSIGNTLSTCLTNVCVNL